MREGKGLNILVGDMSTAHMLNRRQGSTAKNEAFHAQLYLLWKHCEASISGKRAVWSVEIIRCTHRFQFRSSVN